MSRIIDGRATARVVEEKIKKEVANLKGRPPALAVVLVGSNPASNIYVQRKRAACSRVGIQSILKEFDDTISEDHLIQEIKALNADDAIDAILVQLPLPHGIIARKIALLMDPKKDVDGFHPTNLGKLLIDDPSALVACTPLGICMLLQMERISLEGAHVVVVGRSSIVGKPLSVLLSQNRPGLNATVTLCHSKTVDLPAFTKAADVIVVATGQPKILTKEMLSKNSIVIDVGINRLLDPSSPSGYKVVGDVDFDEVKEVTSAITPVPGGIGPMTIAALLSNTLKCYRLRGNE